MARFFEILQISFIRIQIFKADQLKRFCGNRVSILRRAELQIPQEFTRNFLDRGLRRTLEKFAGIDMPFIALRKNDRNTPLASSELPVHRAIYQSTNAQAIVHAHPPYSTALSLAEQEIVPRDEWYDVIGKVPVLGFGQNLKPGSLDETVAQELKDRRVVMLYGHGSFSIGQLLEEAFSFTTVLEEAAKVLCLLKSINSGNINPV